MTVPDNNAPDEGGQQRRKRLLREIFRNAMALAIAKQALVAGSAAVEIGSGKATAGESRKIPPHLLG